jgi:hypothetical protein
LVELQLAAELNPADRRIQELLETVRVQLRTKIAVSREGKTKLESLIERAQHLPPAGPDFPADVKLPATLTFRDASTRDVYTALARFAGINIVFDPQFRDQPVTIDLRNTSLENALKALSAATQNFYRVSAQRTITVSPTHPRSSASTKKRSSRRLPEQRRRQRDDGSASHRHRRTGVCADHRDQRAVDQGHTGARCGGRQADRRG